MKITKHCLFCEGDSCWKELYPQSFKDGELDAKIFSARRVTEHFHYRIVKCLNTGLIFSREILPDEELKNLYAKSEVTFSKYNDIIRRDYWRPLASYSTVLRKDLALEIGCSSGYFLEELKQQGFMEVCGCEPSHEAKMHAHASVQESIHTGFFTSESYPDNSFDLICSFQTLDHVSDPLELLKTCYQKLKKRAWIYLIVHNTNALQAKFFGEKSPIIDVEHIYLFNPKNLKCLVEKAGFIEAKTFPIKNSYPLEYLTSHAPLPFKKQINAWVHRLGMENIPVPIRLGNMGIIARKA